MFVILEGTDGTGKTTLARKIAEEYGAGLRHVGPPRIGSTPLAEHLDYVFTFDGYGTATHPQSQLFRTVFDRFHLGGYVYGKVFRSHLERFNLGDWAPYDFELFENLIRKRCLLVLCDPGWEKVEGEWNQRQGKHVGYPEYESSLQVVRQTYDLFRFAYDNITDLNRVVYDYTKEDAWDSLTSEVEKSIGWSITTDT